MYIKGYEKESYRRFFGQLFDEPKRDLLIDEKQYIIEIQYIDESGLMRFNDLESFGEKFYIAREISEEEFMLYKNMQVITSEFFLNQITGGFPNKDSVSRCSRDMVQLVKKAYNKTVNINETESIVNILSSISNKQNA